MSEFVIPLAIVATIGGTTASIISTANAQQKQEKADAVQRSQTALANQKAIKQAINQGRVARAELLTSGQSQTGGFSSSSIQGALGSAQTQEASNIGFARQTAAANSAVNLHLGRARRSLSRAGSFGAIANLPGQFGISFSDLFERKPQETGTS